MKRFTNFLYNLDRAVASLFGAPAQATISSEIGEHDDHKLVEVAEDLLNKIDTNHIQIAVEHAKRLEAVDSGPEK